VAFSEKFDAVDEVFVEDSHESPGLLIAVADVLAQRLHDALLAGTDFLAQRFHDALIAGPCLGASFRKLSPHFVAELDDLHFKSGDALGQSLEDLYPSLQHT
jgi:hypothetical protein